MCPSFLLFCSIAALVVTSRWKAHCSDLNRRLYCSTLPTARLPGLKRPARTTDCGRFRTVTVRESTRCWLESISIRSRSRVSLRRCGPTLVGIANRYAYRRLFPGGTYGFSLTEPCDGLSSHRHHPSLSWTHSGPEDPVHDSAGPRLLTMATLGAARTGPARGRDRTTT